MLIEFRNSISNNCYTKNLFVLFFFCRGKKKHLTTCSVCIDSKNILLQMKRDIIIAIIVANIFYKMVRNVLLNVYMHCMLIVLLKSLPTSPYRFFLCRMFINQSFCCVLFNFKFIRAYHCNWEVYINRLQLPCNVIVIEIVVCGKIVRWTLERWEKRFHQMVQGFVGTR